MKKIAVLFPGQGISLQAVGELAQTHNHARSIFKEASEVLGKDLFSLIGSQSIPDQAVIVTANVVYFECFVKAQNLLPAIHYMAGHSLGEYSALICSEAVSLSDMLPAIEKRQQFMDACAESVNGSMCVVKKTSHQELEQMLLTLRQEGKEIAISAYNSPKQAVVSGTNEAIESLEERLGSNTSLVRLNIKGPLHSSLMMPARTKLKAVLEKVKFGSMHCPVYSSVTGEAYQSTDDIIPLLLRQITEPIRWSQLIQALWQKQTGLFLNCGPSNTLENLLDHFQLPVRNLNINKASDREASHAYMTAHGPEYVSAMSQSLVYAASIPMQVQHGTNQLEEINTDYQQLWQLYEDNLQHNKGSKDALKQALPILKSILSGKGLQEPQLTEIFTKLSFESGIQCL